MIGRYRAEVYRRAAKRGLMTAACSEVGLTCFESYPATGRCPVCWFGETRAPRWSGKLRGPGFVT